MPDRIPANLEAEQAAVGSLLISREAHHTFREIGLTAADFYRQAHELLFAVVSGMHERDETVDLITVQAALQSAGTLAQVGGMEYVMRLLDETPTAAHARHYGEIVKEKATLRQYLDLAGRITGLAQTADTKPADVSALISRAESEISRGFAIGTWTPYDEVIQHVIQRMEEPESLMGLPTGIVKLDRMTMGLHKKTLIVIAARPGMGKTALALQIAENVAREGTPVALFSLEMDKDELGLRSIQAATGYSGYAIRGHIPDENWTGIMRAAGPLSSLPIYVDDEPTVKHTEIFPKARRAVHEHGCGLIVFDYAQLAEGPKGDSRNREVGEIFRAMRTAAKRLDVPWIALSQLSRDCEKENRAPRKSDLRDSGEIEAEANVILMIHHDQIIIAKNRQLATGLVPVTWLPNVMRFVDREEERSVPDGPLPYYA